MDAQYSDRVVRFKALAHCVRLQIMEVLANGPATVGELAVLTGRRQPYISQQLAVLYSAGLVSKKRCGLNMIYCLAKQELRDFAADIHSLCRELS